MAQETNQRGSSPVTVQRLSEDPPTWLIDPQDETWLPLVVSRCFEKNPLSSVAVLKPHPQDTGVQLRGSSGELLEGLEAARAHIEALRKAGLASLRCPSFSVACLVRRVLLTRPLCLTAVSVSFTMHVEDSEFEPMAAHRLGQLVYQMDGAEPLAEAQAFLYVPLGERALARHLQLPAGVTLLNGLGDVALGLRASREPSSALPGKHLLATVELRAGSVFRDYHARHCAVAGLSYYPEVRVRLPFVKGTSEKLRRAGFKISSAGVITSERLPARQEFLEQLLPDATFDAPRTIQLDFTPLSYPTREATLAAGFEQVLVEIEDVKAQLQKFRARQISR